MYLSLLTSLFLVEQAPSYVTIVPVTLPILIPHILNNIPTMNNIPVGNCNRVRGAAESTELFIHILFTYRENEEANLRQA